MGTLLFILELLRVLRTGTDRVTAFDSLPDVPGDLVC